MTSPEEAWIGSASRQAGLAASVRDLHRAVLRRFLDTGAAPALDWLRQAARELGNGDSAVAELEAADLVHSDDGTVSRPCGRCARSTRWASRPWPALSATSSLSNRSKTVAIESRSLARNRGLMSRSKLSLPPSPGDAMSRPPRQGAGSWSSPRLASSPVKGRHRISVTYTTVTARRSRCARCARCARKRGGQPVRMTYHHGSFGKSLLYGTGRGVISPARLVGARVWR
jgi:hypothetical protein